MLYKIAKAIWICKYWEFYFSQKLLFVPRYFEKKLCQSKKKILNFLCLITITIQQFQAKIFFPVIKLSSNILSQAKLFKTSRIIANPQVDMFRFVFLLCTTFWFVDSIIYIDRQTLDFDGELANWSVSYFHDQKRNSVSNVTLHLFKNFSKILIYFNVKVSEDANDKEYRREVCRTVMDYCKFMQNTRGNPILRAFLSGLRKSFPTNVTYPMVMVRFEQKTQWNHFFDF